jgi:hypothetical protein
MPSWRQIPKNGQRDQNALAMIHEANYSFSSQASGAAARVHEENYIYEVSFDPKNIPVQAKNLSGPDI